MGDDESSNRNTGMMLRVKATNLQTGDSEERRMPAFAGLTAEDVSRLLLNAEENRLGDRQKFQLAQLRNLAQSLAYLVRVAVEERPRALSRSGVTAATVALDELDAARDGADVEGLKSAIHKVQLIADDLTRDRDE